MSAEYSRAERAQHVRAVSTGTAARAAMADAIEAWLARDCDQTETEISGVRVRPLFSLDLLRGAK